MRVLILTVLFLLALPVQAMVSDPAVLQQARLQQQTLKLQERQIQQDYDAMQRRLDDLRRQNADPKVIDQLARQVDQQYRDLTQTQYAERDLERSFL